MAVSLREFGDLGELLAKDVPCWDEVVARLGSHPHEAAVKYILGGGYLLPLEFVLRSANGGDGPPPPPAVLRAFIDAHRGDGRVPLHLCPDAEVARVLLDARPEAATERDMVGRTILHRLALPSEGILANNESEAQVSLRRSRAAEIARAVLETCPESARVKDNKGRIPLHYVGRDGDADLVWALVDAHPEGLWTRDCGGEMPLRFQEEENGVSAGSPSGRLALPPLHALIQAGCDTLLIGRVIRARPAATTTRDRLGRTALAVAASVTAPSPLLLFALLKKRHSGKEAVRMTDKSGRLPLNLAIEAGWDARSLRKLWRAEPRALSTRDVATRMYPFMIAAGVGPESDVDIAYELLREDPGVIECCLSRTSPN